MTLLLSVGPEPLTARPPLATSPQEISLNLVERSVVTVRPETLNVRSGHRPLTLVTIPENSWTSPPGAGDGDGDGDGDGEGEGDGGGEGAGAGVGAAS